MATDNTIHPRPDRTIDEALARFELVRGTAGSEADGKACAMSLLVGGDGDRRAGSPLTIKVAKAGKGGGHRWSSPTSCPPRPLKRPTAARLRFFFDERATPA
ncbi:MAG: hypothetical protein H6983_26585 [Ectothiorhodospiraceae bacterium]|nr:hypothetical protein [Ectothiorhodospiraceae bacterium]